MPDNGFGNKANSFDFLIRAYYIRPDFKTPHGGIRRRRRRCRRRRVHPVPRPARPDRVPDRQRGRPARLLTGADIDPESLQRGRNGDLWVGDEFGPWILHFDADGVLLEAPIELPGGMSPNQPGLGGQPATQSTDSRGFEAMAMSPNGRYLYAVLEGADGRRRPRRHPGGSSSSTPATSSSPAEWPTTATDVADRLRRRRPGARRRTRLLRHRARRRRGSRPLYRNGLRGRPARRRRRRHLAKTLVARPRRHPRPRRRVAAADPRRATSVSATRSG